MEVLMLLLLAAAQVNGKSLVAQFNMGGIVGNVTFQQASADDNVTIIIDLDRVGAETANVTWEIFTWPTNYDSSDRCTAAQLGTREIDLSARHGILSLPVAYTLDDGNLNLWGPNTIWDKSLVLSIAPRNTPISCARIVEEEPITIVVAQFFTPAAGSITFQQAQSDKLTALIHVDLFHVSNSKANPSQHSWQILVTDVLDTQRSEQKCDRLQTLYDPGNIDNLNCSSNNHLECKVGDLTLKHGQLNVGKVSSRFSRQRFIDMNLLLPDLRNSARSLFLVLYDAVFPDTILACARMYEVVPRQVVAFLDSDGVRGSIKMSQTSPVHPTQIQIHLDGLDNKAAQFHIHEFPVMPKIYTNDSVCSLTGGHFNPFKVDASKSPAPSNGTYDLFQVGDLSGKYGNLSDNTVFAEFVDPYIQLFGERNVMGRSIVIHLVDGKRWVCATLEPLQTVTTAVATLVHPVGGRIIFRALSDDPLAETSVFVEGLVYNDGHGNATMDHRWQINTQAVGRDFLNWTARCQSAGAIYNPYEVNVVERSRSDCGNSALRCNVGDLTRKSGKLKIASHWRDVNISRLFFVDSNLPLKGPASIIGHTIVIFDDHAPDFRGNRMACHIIYRLYPVRASVKQWHSAEIPVPVLGQIQWGQSTRYDITHTMIDISGLDKVASGYHVHEVSVPIEPDFPCSNDAVYGHFNPFNVSVANSPLPGLGSTDQYEVGDMSGKYGTLEEKDLMQEEFLDHNLPLQGYNAILGRSVVIHKKEKNARWVCGTVTPDVPETTAKEIRAIASFHVAGGFAYGYIRLTQIVALKEGSSSDTTIEVSLSYPGRNNRNLTVGHNWAIYVNPVGHDATVKPQADRCVASGFKWNPYLVDDSREDYKTECSAHNPFRCVMGDLSGRHGPIVLGGPRRIFSDPNLSLTGPYRVLDRSIVIHDKKGGEQRFACGNIRVEKHVTQVITLKNPSRFSSASFMDEARQALEIPEWLMYAEAEKTKEVQDGACVQVTVHYIGPDVQQLQADFTHLIKTGRVYRTYATQTAPKKPPKFGYRTCKTDRGNSANSLSSSWPLSTWLLIIMLKSILF